MKKILGPPVNDISLRKGMGSNELVKQLKAGGGFVAKKVGVAVDILERDPLLADLPTPWHAFAAHLDEVVAPPAPWRVLAANDACAVEAMRYGDRPVWGIQPHPETPPDHARVLMQTAISHHPEYEREIRQALASPARDDQTAAKIVATFLAT